MTTKALHEGRVVDISENARVVGHVDLTPTWESILPAIRAAIEYGKSPTVRETMWEELTRMARLADAYVAGRK